MCFFSISGFAQDRNLYEEEILKEPRREEFKIAAVKETKQKTFIKEALKEEDLQEHNLVEVESKNILSNESSNTSTLVPYKVRRKNWGHLFTLSYVLLNPEAYESEFDTATFDEAYGKSVGMIEGSYDFKYNFKIGSLAAQFGVGVLSASGDKGVDSNISLVQLRTGLKYTIDNLFYEPVVAPYVGGGIYSIRYKESFGSDSVNGVTGSALYFLFGAMLQLDWIDKPSALEAYLEGNIENTFLFLEARNYFASEVEKDPDFSTEFSIATGLSLEF